MKIILSENQLGLLRRFNEIDRLIEPTMDMAYKYLRSGQPYPLRIKDFDLFLHTVKVKISNELANESGFQGDEKITLRNQIQRFIESNYYPDMKSYFLSRLNHNINESEDKKKKFLKDKFGLDLTDKIKIVTSVYDVPMEFDDVIGPEAIKRYLNFFGPMYLIRYDGIDYLYQDRGGEYGEVIFGSDDSEYYDNEFAEKLGIDILGFTISDLVDIYFGKE